MVVKTSKIFTNGSVSDSNDRFEENINQLLEDAAHMCSLFIPEEIFEFDLGNFKDDPQKSFTNFIVRLMQIPAAQAQPPLILIDHIESYFLEALKIIKQHPDNLIENLKKLK